MSFKKPQPKAKPQKNFEQKPLTGALFDNDKDGVETRPDYTGYVLDETGNKYRVAAWIHEAQSGKEYLSLSLNPVDE